METRKFSFFMNTAKANEMNNLKKKQIEGFFSGMKERIKTADSSDAFALHSMTLLWCKLNIDIEILSFATITKAHELSMSRVSCRLWKFHIFKVGAFHIYFSGRESLSKAIKRNRLMNRVHVIQFNECRFQFWKELN